MRRNGKLKSKDSHAMKFGVQHAGRALAARREAESRRKAALAKLSAPGVTALAATNRGTLVAEGDSWFDYPGTDVLSVLEDEHGFEIESVARKGDRVEAMAYSSQLDDFCRLLTKLIRRQQTPRAILLSGGGNDVAGDEFHMLLNHRKSPVGGLNQQVVRGIVDERIRYAYISIISGVTKVCQDLTGKTIPILVHGYDYAVPDGRGFWGGFWFLPGPWLKPGFEMKGYEDLAETTAMIASLINSINIMLESVAALRGFEHVKHVDLRRTLSNKPKDYTDWWDNELHPSKEGFRQVADRFAKAIP